MLKSCRAGQKVRSRAGNEPKGVIAVLGILPEVDVAMVEDVSTHVDIVETLGRQNHADIVSSIKQGDHLDEEVEIGNLISIKDADQLMGGDGHALGVDLAQAVVQVAGLPVHLAWLALSARNIDQV